MTATAQPQGLVPARHPSGTIRVESQIDGVLSGYTSNIFTGTPVTRGTDGTLQVAAGAAAVILGVFQGCEYTSATKRFLLPYFPANTVYEAGSMIARFTADNDLIFEGQSVGPVLAVDIGGGCNIGAISGNTMTGFSTQALSAPTGATAASFIIVGIAAYDDNKAGDLFTKVLVKISAPQGQVALADGMLSDDESRAREESNKRFEEDRLRAEEDTKRDEQRRNEDRERDKARKAEDDQREQARRDEEQARKDAERAPQPEQYPAQMHDPQAQAPQPNWPQQPA